MNRLLKAHCLGKLVAVHNATSGFETAFIIGKHDVILGDVMLIVSDFQYNACWILYRSEFHYIHFPFLEKNTSVVSDLVEDEIQ